MDWEEADVKPNKDKVDNTAILRFFSMNKTGDIVIRVPADPLVDWKNTRTLQEQRVPDTTNITPGPEVDGASTPSATPAKPTPESTVALPETSGSAANPPLPKATPSKTGTDASKDPSAPSPTPQISVTLPKAKPVVSGETKTSKEPPAAKEKTPDPPISKIKVIAYAPPLIDVPDGYSRDNDGDQLPSHNEGENEENPAPITVLRVDYIKPETPRGLLVLDAKSKATPTPTPKPKSTKKKKS